MLDDAERSLISIKHRLQHHPTFLLFLSVNKTVAVVWSPCSTLLSVRVPANLTLAMIRCLYLLRAFRVDVKIQYGEWVKFSVTRRRKYKQSLRKWKKRAKQPLKSRELWARIYKFFLSRGIVELQLIFRLQLSLCDLPSPDVEFSSSHGKLHCPQPLTLTLYC